MIRRLKLGAARRQKSTNVLCSSSNVSVKSAAGRVETPGAYNGSTDEEDLMSYVNGYVLPVPKRNWRAYKKMATLGRNIWTKHGALDYKECDGDDLVPQVRRVVHQDDETQAGRNRGVRLHRVQVPNPPRSSQREGDEGDDRQRRVPGHAVRHEANGDRRLKTVDLESSLPFTPMATRPAVLEVSVRRAVAHAVRVLARKP